MSTRRLRTLASIGSPLPISITAPRTCLKRCTGTATERSMPEPEGEGATLRAVLAAERRLHLLEILGARLRRVGPHRQRLARRQPAHHPVIGAIRRRLREAAIGARRRQRLDDHWPPKGETMRLSAITWPSGAKTRACPSVGSMSRNSTGRTTSGDSL